MKHFYTGIKGWFAFSDLYAEVVRNASSESKSTFVEVGAWKGRSAAFMGVEIANSRKPIDFFTVDTWLGSDEPAHKQDPDVQAGTLYRTFRRNMGQLLDHEVKPMRMTSVQASKYFKDESVDFLFLDGDHTYEGVMADLKAWMPKMQPNGLVAGDDYNWSGVNRAIKEVFGEDRIVVLGEGKGRHWKIKPRE